MRFSIFDISYFAALLARIEHSVMLCLYGLLASPLHVHYQVRNGSCVLTKLTCHSDDALLMT